MPVKVFLFLITFGVVLLWVGWGIIIFQLDPDQAGPLGFSNFYLSLFLAFLGTIFLVGNFLRSKFFKKQMIYKRINTSLRQAVFFSLLIISWAFLHSNGLAKWWNILLFILILTVLEFFFVSRKREEINYERGNFRT